VAPGDRLLHGAALEIFRGLSRPYEGIVDYATLYQDRYGKRWVTERTGADRGGFVLDLGCGTLLLEERYVNLGWKFVGMDLTKEIVKIGKAKILPNVCLLVNGDAENLPFQDLTFDAVVSCYAPKYVKTSRLVHEVCRVCKHGGSVVVYDFARPRGILAPFLGLYIRVGLMLAGLLLKLGKRSEESTFNNLPRIIYETRWDGEIAHAMEASGFDTLEAGPLTGGAVFGYFGRKR